MDETRNKKVRGKPAPRLPDAHLWEEEARCLMLSHIKRSGLTYKGLVRLLDEQGMKETEKSLSAKISRGTFSFVFFLRVMRALKMTDVDIGAFGTPTAPNPRKSTEQG